MHCLSFASLRYLLPNWIQSLWISSGEQSREHLDPTVPNASSPYTATDPAVYELQNTEVAYNVTKPLPVCIPNQVERAPRTRTPLKIDLSNRPRAISIESDNTDCEIIELPNIASVNGKIICVEEEH
ncbi:uncharacterized protein N7525_006454 [Penicillium rubens]|uniref:uncharacterized protein n=1 Tax=Penicillium rubens TaxID=1108849 RepID=UPI002A5A9F7A|nr:uncharacterized protein N7525_006454 [Penicillium rubens]KAJ5828201.1 hypothetical protein N7525_006454 [Penicillium rubens]